jgi:hypothetical protein
LDTAEPPRISAPAPAEANAQPWESNEPRRDPRALELGAAGFLLSGGGAGSYAGISPFVVAEMGQSILLRPSVAFGQSLVPDLRSSWVAARFDTCVRIAGLYTTGSGIQLDLCAGLGAGVSYVGSGTQAGAPAAGQTLPYVELGPSIDLRAEVGSAAVTLRAAAGADVAREGFTDVTGTRVDAPGWPVRLEIGFSWDLHALARD